MYKRQEALRVSSGSDWEASAACAVCSEDDGVGDAEPLASAALGDAELGKVLLLGAADPDEFSEGGSSEEPHAESTSSALSAVTASSGRVAERVPLGVGDVVIMATVSYFSARNAARITCAR